MTLENIKSAAEFDEFVKDDKTVSVVHFSADWAEQCTQMNNSMNEMIQCGYYKKAKFAKVAAEDLPEISLRYGVSAVPTVLFLRDGKVVDRVDGANTASMISKTKEQISDTLGDPTDEKPEISLEERLKKLISQAPCVLFMKGDPATPRCGFSRTIVSLLDGYRADYTTFDILQDNEVREGLKKFSNWPTYPQLYINGELVGGLDIVKEMSESGELDSMLPKKS